MPDRSIIGRWSIIRAERRAGLIPYLTAGYPSLAQTAEALRMVVEAGADFVEVGVPFSDPLADGPVIQRSSFAALQQGTTVSKVLALIHDLQLPIPVIVFSYLNPIMSYGVERFASDARAAGVSGLLLTDLPVGEDDAIERRMRSEGLDLIRLIAPTTDRDRLTATVQGAGGFLYVIARLGVTGAPTQLDTQAAELVARVRDASRLPIALGFGLATGEQAKAAATLADGVVVGSALVERLAEGIEPARRLMIELRRAVQGPFDRHAQ